MKKNIVLLGIILVITIGTIIGFLLLSKPNSIEQTQDQEVYVNLHLNMRLMPLDRGYFFEDPIMEALEKKEIGEVTGGGTSLSEEGMPTSCDVEIYIKLSKKQEFIEYIKSLNNIAKGSYIEIEDEKLEIGTLEGLNIMLDGISLPSSVYKENDVNDVIDDMDKLLKGKGQFFSYYYGERYTNLYFYGESYEEMKQIIEDYTKNCPLCQNSIIEKI